MHVLLYAAAILCAVFGLAFWPLIIVALVLAALGVIVSNTRPRRLSVGEQLERMTTVRLAIGAGLVVCAVAAALAAKHLM